jgi:hypothetical protein
MSAADIKAARSIQEELTSIAVDIKAFLIVPKSIALSISFAHPLRSKRSVKSRSTNVGEGFISRTMAGAPAITI